MATITDIEKLRPELLDISDAEFYRRKAELEMAEHERKRRAAIKEKEEIAAQAAKHVDSVVAGLKWLHDNGILPERLTSALSRGDGTFIPGTILKAPKAEDLVPREMRARKKRIRNVASGPGMYRRVRDPKTGELVPSKAARQAGVKL